MLDINFIKNNKYFTKLTLKNSEVLFDEWDIDDNLYIIESWILGIEKYTTIEKTESKELAKLNAWAIFWEWSLKWTDPKQVKIVAKENTILYKIDAKKWIRDFISDFPSEWIDLLNEIIDISNKRLLESNFLVTSNYEMSKTISEINLFDNKSLFNIIDKFKKIIWAEYIMYLEKNPVMDNYLTVKYDTRIKWKMQNNLIDLHDNILDIEDIINDWIKVEKYNHIQKLKNRNEVVWYLIIWESENILTEWQKKAISSISVLIAWYIREKLAYEEKKNIEHISN